MGPRWNPWAELRARDDLVFALEDLPGGLDGVYWPFGEVTVIVIDRSLDRRRRRTALAHELTHDALGGGCPRDGMPETWKPVVLRDEARVDRVVAERLVPLDQLAELVERIEELGEPVRALDVVEEFDVDVSTAQRALSLLDRQRRAS